MIVFFLFIKTYFMLTKTFKSRINHLDNYGAGVLSIRVKDTIEDANIEKVATDSTYLNFIFQVR